MSRIGSPNTRQAGQSSRSPAAKLIAQPTAKAERRRRLEVANQIAIESDWRGDLARIGAEVIDIDDAHEVYGVEK